MKCKLLLLVTLCAMANSLWGAVITSTGVGGNWTAGGSWVGGVAPGAGDDVIIASGATISMNATSTCLSLTMNGTAFLDFPTNNITLTVNGPMTMNGSSQVTGNNNNRILSLQGDLNIPAGQSGLIGGVRVAQVITGTFNLGGSFIPTDNTGQKTFGNANFFDGCFLDAGVTEAITIAGNLAVLPTVPGLHARIGRISITVTGTTTVSGYLEFKNSSAGTKTFNNTITVAAGATWDNTIGEDPVINCSILNNGLWPVPTGGNGRYDVTNAVGVYTYSGNTEIGMTRLRIRNGATVTNDGLLRLTKVNSQGLSVESGSTFINGATGYLMLESEPIPVDITGGGSSVNFSTAGNTVEYLFAGNQDIHPTTYFNLTSSAGGTKTINGTTTINAGLVTINDNTLVDITGGTDMTGTASLVMNGTSSLQISSAGVVPALTGAGHTLTSGTTIFLNRGGAQTAAPSANYLYQNLTINGNAGSNVAMTTVSLIQGNLTFTTSGRMNNNPVLTVNGAFDYGSAVTTTLAADILVSNFIASNGTINYSGRTITVFGDNGTWTNNGGGFTTDAASVAAFTTGINQSIGGTANTTFSNLAVNNSNGLTLDRDATASEFLTFATGSGNLVTGTNTMILTKLAVNVTRTAPNPGFVEGNLRKSVSAALPFLNPAFEVGTGTRFTPLNTTFAGVVGVGTVTVSTTGSDSPEIFSALIQPDQSINRIWSVTNNSLTFTTVDMTANFIPIPGGDPDAVTDVTNGSVMIIKGFNNSTLTWFAIPVAPAPVFNTNSFSFTGLAVADLPIGQQVDIQAGETINPTFVFNRITGAGLLWSNQTTWIQVRSGIISVDLAGNVTGTLTNFSGPDAELADGDQVMLLSAPGTVFTVVPGSRTNDVTMQIAPPPGAPIANAPFGRQYVPGIAPPVSDVDAVSIGNTNIADATTGIILDVSAQILILNVGSTSRVTAQTLTHQNSTRMLTVLANATVSQPGGSVSNDWNINDAVADVAGDVTIGTGTNNTLARVSRINITTGALSAGNLRFRPFNSGGRHVQTVLNLTGAGTVNLRGALTFNGNRGTLNSAVGSTFNYVRSASSQSIIVPSSSAAAWVYHNIHVNNTSAAGAAFGFTSSATSVTGNLRVQTGKMTVINLNIIGDPARTFEVANGATFEMLSASGAGAGGFPSGFGTYTNGPTSTVAYNQTGNTNPWPVFATTYGHLIIGQNASIRNFQLANATTTVAGNLTIGTGTSTPDLLGTGASSVLTVAGDLLINALAVLNATNIADINAGGNWTNNGSFTESTNRVTFNSPAANVLQTIGGATAETFYNLALSTSAATDVIRLSNTTHVTNDLILTQGELDLNSNTLFIDKSAIAAIARTSGYIKSEDIVAPYGTIKWFIDNTTGVHQYPFGKSSTEFIPFIFNVTVAGNKGVGTGYVAASTYATAAANPPGEYPSIVTNLNGTTGGASVTDRYWVITLGAAEYVTARPTATMIFTALNSEKPTTWTAIGEPPTNTNSLLAQGWSLANYWDPAQTLPVQTYANDSPAAGTFQVGVPGLNSFSPAWTITDSSVPLPIELVEFKAKLNQGGVELTWRTETELNNDFFTIQRTGDGESFEDIVSVKGAGTTTSPKAYSAQDYHAAPGKWYYRLKQTDFDGKFSYSKLVAVNVPESLFLSIYPNPSNGSEVTIALSLTDIGKSASLKIQDVNGKEMFLFVTERLESAELKIEIPEKLAAGLYIISVAVDQQVSRQKLIVK